VQRRNVRGTQVRVENLSTRLKGLRAFVLTGTADIDHPRETDEEIVIGSTAGVRSRSFATSLTEGLSATDTC
jgi:hypothetical protein